MRQMDVYLRFKVTIQINPNLELYIVTPRCLIDVNLRSQVNIMNLKFKHLHSLKKPSNGRLFQVYGKHHENRRLKAVLCPLGIGSQKTKSKTKNSITQILQTKCVICLFFNYSC